VLISDFQRGGWRGEEGIRLPQGTTVTPIAIGGSEDQVNVGVTAGHTTDVGDVQLTTNPTP